MGITSKGFFPNLRLGKFGTAEEACRQYEVYLRNNQYLLNSLSELRGKTLGCWCTNSYGTVERPICHGQVLLKLLHEQGLQ
jgi:hypothetical protein